MAIEYLNFKVPYTLNKITYLITFNHDKEGLAILEDGSSIELGEYPAWMFIGLDKGRFVEKSGVIFIRGKKVCFFNLTYQELTLNKDMQADYMLFENLLVNSPSISFDELQTKLIKEFKN